MVAQFAGNAAAEAIKPRFKLEFEKGEDSLAVHHFSVHERLSTPFEVHVSARSQNPEIVLDDLVGKTAGLGVTAEIDVVAWTGICTEFEQVQAETSSPTSLSTYRIVIMPSLWLLGQRRGHRIYQHVTVDDVVKKILAEYEIDATWKIGAYPKREYVVQYGETDLAFVSRLLEEAGISYWFDKDGAGKAGKNPTGRKVQSKLVFGDHLQSNPTLGALRFHDSPHFATPTKYATNVRVAHDVRPGKVTYRDYDFRKPRLPLLDSSTFPLSADEAPEAPYELYHYAHGVALIEVSPTDPMPVGDKYGAARHDKPENAARAERSVEAERYRKLYVEIDSNEANLAPAQVFTIDEHPHPDLAPSKPLLVVETTVFGNVGEWSLAAVAVPSDPKVRYRPPLLTPKPHVPGLQTAIVVGPSGKEIWTDELGRVRVRFHWDREGAFDDTATCWLRVNHAWAGAGFGSVLLPRVGQEVLVDFFEGNPDMPVVVGRLHNSTTAVPRALPKFMTQSTWRSASSPQKDGCFNEIMMDDDAGKELVFVQAQRDLNKLVKHDETERTGKERTILVGAARIAAVAQHDTLQVGKQHLVKVVGVNDLHIPEMGAPDYSPKDTWIEMVDKKITLTTGKASVVLDGANINIDAEGALRFTADGQLIMQGANVYLNCKPATAVSPHADKKVLDPVDKPDRMIGKVEDLFWTKEIQKQLAAKALQMSLPGAAPPGAAPGGLLPPTPAPSAATLASAAEPNEPPVDAAAIQRNDDRVAARKQVAEHFYEQNGTTWDPALKGRRPFDPTDPADRDEIASHLDGIDFSKPVAPGVSPPPPPPALGQWQKPGGNKGNYYAATDLGPEKLGIGDYAADSSGKLVPKVNLPYDLANGTPFLKTQASPKTDTWSATGTSQPTVGGGTQYYIGDIGKCSPNGPPVTLPAGMKSTVFTPPSTP
jgi:type VI secretion system secreted protein VgrG